MMSKCTGDALESQGLPCASLLGSPEAKQAALRHFGAIPSAADEMQGDAPLAASMEQPASDATEGCGIASSSSSGAPCHVLLVPMFGGASGAGGSGAAGLNLQVASVAVLLEPQLQVPRLVSISSARPQRVLISSSSRPHSTSLPSPHRYRFLSTSIAYPTNSLGLNSSRLAASAALASSVPRGASASSSATPLKETFFSTSSFASLHGLRRPDLLSLTLCTS